MKLNLGRNCLKIIIRTYGIKEIFIPYYSCNTIWQAVKEEHCKIKFYHIDKNFMPVNEFDENDFILYINYFGLYENNVKKLCQKYKNIIVDNTQSFYSKPEGLASFNSLRKFFPVQNGAYLWCMKNLNESFPTDDIHLAEATIHDNYELFRRNEHELNKEEIKMISPDVEKAMKEFDFEKDKKQRVKIYKQYEKVLKNYNLIKLPKLEKNIPYCYPICTKNEKILQKIEENNIIILKLWDKIAKNLPENEFLSNVGALPLTDEEYAYRIIKIILNNC